MLDSDTEGDGVRERVVVEEMDCEGGEEGEGLELEIRRVGGELSSDLLDVGSLISVDSIPLTSWFPFPPFSSCLTLALIPPSIVMSNNNNM